MDQPQQVWSTQLDPGPGEAGPSDGAPSEGEGDGDSRASVCSQPECSICFNTYDNVFKTPKLLDCTHTFCLECLSRLMAVTGAPDQDQGAGGTGPASPAPGAGPAPGQLSCPFCRQHTTLSELGPPALATSREVLCKLPRHQQHAEPVWLEGEKLCYKSPDPDAGHAPASSSSFCICIDIGANKAAEAAAAAAAAPGGGPRRRRPGAFERLTDWKRLLVFVLLTLVLVVVVLWPLQCILTTGNMRCKTDSSFSHTTAASHGR
ncbi:unnamed protein product [Boreogadus saida]